jgi:hypothetical protein
LFSPSKTLRCRSKLGGPAAAVAAVLLLAACAPRATGYFLHDFVSSGTFGERTRVLSLSPGVTATVVAPAQIDRNKRVDLILYALPNGNSTDQTIGRRLTPGMDWHYDIQHIGAQTRALRERGYEQAIVAYLEADSKSWPAWRRALGYERANARIVEIVDEIRTAIGSPQQLAVTLTGHSGGGSFMFGFIEGQTALPRWLERIAFLDANYNFEAPAHGDRVSAWLRQDSRNTLVVIAYDDREIKLDGKKVVSDSGGTWRASQRMIAYLNGPFPLATAKLGDFLKYSDRQIDILLHPNPGNRILHTEMIGELNGYMHALLVRRAGYDEEASVLRPPRAYEPLISK